MIGKYSCFALTFKACDLNRRNKNAYRVCCFFGSSGQEVHHKTFFPLCHTHKQTLIVWPWRWHGLLNGKDPMFLSSKPVGHRWNSKLIDHPYTAFLLLEFNPTNTQKHMHPHMATCKSCFNNQNLNPSFSERVYMVWMFTLTNIPHTGCTVKAVCPLFLFSLWLSLL